MKKNVALGPVAFCSAVILEACGGAAETRNERETSGRDGDLSEPSNYLAYDVDSTGAGRDIFLKSVGRDCEVPLVASPAQEKQPTFSADGSRLAYSSNESGNFQIHVLHLETGDVEQVTSEDDGATFPAWSPDGDRLAFVTGDPANDPNQSNQVMLLDLDSGEPKQLAPPNLGSLGFTGLAFAADGVVLAGNAVSLIAIDTATLEVRDVVPITGRIPNPQYPSVAPDGVRYVFSDFCGNGLQLYVARIDGTTGDTCANAFALDATFKGLVSAS